MRTGARLDERRGAGIGVAGDRSEETSAGRQGGRAGHQKNPGRRGGRGQEPDAMKRGQRGEGAVAIVNPGCARLVAVEGLAAFNRKRDGERDQQNGHPERPERPAGRESLTHTHECLYTGDEAPGQLTQHPCESLTASRGSNDTEHIMKSRRMFTLLVLGLWLFLGPVAMAFDGCLIMGAICEGGPCGASSDTSFGPAPPIGLEPVAYLDAQPRAQLPADTLTALDPPPKSLLSAS
jgi:hypothetical protein